MDKFNTDLTQTLKWMQNNAPNIQSLVNQKYNWYQANNEKYWSDWYRDIFNIDTCNEFGVYVWCEILGLPKSLFVFEPMENNWAFGVERKNYKAATGNTNPNRELVGGNFFGAGDVVINGIEEARLALKLRYATLTSDGRIASINRMLNWIINAGEPNDYSSGKYMYVTDESSTPVNGSSNLNVTLETWEGTKKLSSKPRKIVSCDNRDISIWNGYFFTGWNNLGTPPFGGGYVTAPDGTASAVRCTCQYSSGSDANIATTSSRRDSYASIPQPAKNSRIRFLKPRKAYICSSFFRFGSYDNIQFRIGVVAGGSSTLGKDLIYAGNMLSLTKNPDGTLNITTITLPNITPPGYVRPNFYGYEALADGWYRVWSVIITGNSVVEIPIGGNGWRVPNSVEIANISIYGMGPILQGRYFDFWGNLCEEVDFVSDDQDFTPGPFTYSDVELQVYDGAIPLATPIIPGSFTDYTLDESEFPSKISFAANVKTGKPIIESGRKAFAYGTYWGYQVSTPWEIAVGDGTTFTYNIPTPPGFVEPYSTPMSMEYNIGPALNYSSQFISLLSDRSYGILPQNSGIPYTVVVKS